MTADDYRIYCDMQEDAGLDTALLRIAIEQALAEPVVRTAHGNGNGNGDGDGDGNGNGDGYGYGNGNGNGYGNGYGTVNSTTRRKRP